MSGRGSFTLAPEFWSTFAARNWEREAGVFAGLFPGPILTPDETFAAFVSAFHAFRAHQPGDRPRCHIEGAEVVDGSMYARFLPRPEDGTLEGYARRVSSTLEGRGFGVVINAFHVHHRELWYRLRAFFRGLYALTGLPASRTDPVLFVGDYPLTPFGVHNDRASVFTFSLGRPKRVLLWPRAYFDERRVPRLEDRLLVEHLPFAKDAIDLHIGPKDLMYWPSSHWHLAVAPPGELHATLGVGVYFDLVFTDLIGTLLKQAIGLKSIGSMPSATALPPALEAAWQSIAQASTSGAGRRMLHAEWLRRVTSDGCQPAPEPLAARVDAEDRLQLGEGGPVLYVEDDEGLLVGGNGHTWFNPWPRGTASELTGALDALDRGELVRVGQLVRKSAKQKAAVLPLLTALVGAEALRVYRQTGQATSA
jgi:50S ribosomal protein L16 3-hydroxylase